MTDNPAIPPEQRCPTCQGWGWNQALRRKPLELVVPVTEQRSLPVLMAHLRQRLCCPDCGGSGSTGPKPPGWADLENRR